jgi:zinc protease
MITFRYIFPPIDEFRLDNGLNVMLVPDKEQDAVVVAFQFPVGRFSEPLSKEGTTELMAGMMQKGTETLSSEQFAEKLESTGAMMFSDAGEEHCVFGIRCLSSCLDELLGIMIEMICKPAFDIKEFKRLQQEMITAVQAESVDPVLLANRHFYNEFAGKNHPAGRFHTLQSIPRINVDDIREFYDTFICPDGAMMVVAGNFSVSEFKGKWTGRLTEWKKTRKKQPLIAEPLFNPQQTIVRIVDKPDLTQTSIVMGHAIPGELSSDKNAIALVNYIFGAGNFSSRLMNRVRSKGGKTYNISSQLSPETKFGVITISTSTLNSQAGEVVDSILEEYKLLSRDGIKEEELENAKKYAIGSLAFQLEGVGSIADKLLWLRFYGRTNDYIEKFDELINSLDCASINETIHRHFSSPHFIITAVGKNSEIRDRLSKFGEVKEYNYRDRF